MRDTAQSLPIRAMGPADLNMAADWAAVDGWNPGLADTSCFTVIDHVCLLIAE